MKITTLKQLAVLVEQKRSIYLTSAKKGFTPAAFVLAMPGHVIFNWMSMGMESYEPTHERRKKLRDPKRVRKDKNFFATKR